MDVAAKAFWEMSWQHERTTFLRRPHILAVVMDDISDAIPEREVMGEMKTVRTVDVQGRSEVSIAGIVQCRAL